MICECCVCDNKAQSSKYKAFLHARNYVVYCDLHILPEYFYLALLLQDRHKAEVYFHVYSRTTLPLKISHKLMFLSFFLI